MDSPRGRIYLINAGVHGRTSLDAPFADHFDTCLGCMACETACPSGVRYAPLVEEARAAIERHHPRSLGDRLFRKALFFLLPYPNRLRLLRPSLFVARQLARHPKLLRLLPARLGQLAALAPPASPPSSGPPERTPAIGAARLRVGLVTGCVQQVFFGAVNEASARILAAEGCEVLAPAAQGCCGALALHAGRDHEARAFARRLIQTFEKAGVDQIVVNAAGCGSTMKSYGELMKDEPAWAERASAFAARVRDITETLAGLTPSRAPRHPLGLRVAYHDACHLAHAQGVRQEPRALLEAIPGVALVPLAESEICCGSAGVFNLLQPEMAIRLGQRKAAALAQAGADVVVTSNPGCILQMGGAARAEYDVPPIRHIVEIVDASIRGLSAETLASRAGSVTS
jgi:glycolate oxidase iron-sulfur subunit